MSGSQNVNKCIVTESEVCSVTYFRRKALFLKSLKGILCFFGNAKGFLTVTLVVQLTKLSELQHTIKWLANFKNLWPD